MQYEKSFVGGYKFNESENKDKDIDGFLSDSILNATYPVKNLISKVKDKQNTSKLENMGIPAGLVLSVPKLVSYNQRGGENKPEGENPPIPEVIPDSLFDKLFGLISSNKTPKGGFNTNSKTKKIRTPHERP